MADASHYTGSASGAPPENDADMPDARACALRIYELAESLQASLPDRETIAMCHSIKMTALGLLAKARAEQS